MQEISPIYLSPEKSGLSSLIYIVKKKLCEFKRSLMPLHFGNLIFILSCYNVTVLFSLNIAQKLTYVVVLLISKINIFQVV